MKIRRLVVPGLLLLSFACAKREEAPPPQTATQAPRATPARAEEKEVLTPVDPPAAAGSAEPFLSAAGDSTLASWLEPVAGSDRTALRFSRYRNGSWSAPATIIERNDLFVNWADFPSIVDDGHGALFTHWLQKSSAGTYAYDVWMATSTDDGRTWSKAFLLNNDHKKAEHGFVTLAALPQGGVGISWLDGRKMTESEHGHDGGDMMLRYATVDAKGTIANDVELDGRTCECCATGMTMTPDGPVVVYRDRSPEEIRDIATVRMTANGWTKPAVIHPDGWKIAGCPVNGPQIASIDKSAVVAWFTSGGGHPRVHVAFSDDGGATFVNPLQVDGGKPIGRLDVVMLKPTIAVVSWLEQTENGAEIRAREVHRDGRMNETVTIAPVTAARSGGFVRMANHEHNVWFTWTDVKDGDKRVRVAWRHF